MVAAQSRAPGFQGYRFEPPVPGVQENWLAILRFDTEANLQRWLDSPERRTLLQEAAPFTEESHARIVRIDTAIANAPPKELDPMQKDMINKNYDWPPLSLPHDPQKYEHTIERKGENLRTNPMVLPVRPDVVWPDCSAGTSMSCAVSPSGRGVTMVPKRVTWRTSASSSFSVFRKMRR